QSLFQLQCWSLLVQPRECRAEPERHPGIRRCLRRKSGVPLHATAVAQGGNGPADIAALLPVELLVGEPQPNSPAMGSVPPQDLALLTGDEQRATDGARARSIRRALLVANPASRLGGRRLPRAVAALQAAGVRSDVVLTERPGHAAEIVAERSAGYD